MIFPKIFPNVPKRSHFFPKTFQTIWGVFFMPNFALRNFFLQETFHIIKNIKGRIKEPTLS